MKDKSYEEHSTMKIVVLGATGGTGIQIVRQAILRGHAVTAFARSLARLQSFADSITVRQGDLLNSAELENVLNGHDAILSAFGPRVPIAQNEKNLLQHFATALSSAMLRTAVNRVVVESTAFLFKDSLFPPAYLLGKVLFPSVVMDASAMEGIFQRGQLDWTLIRPPRLTDDPASAKYRVREGHLPRFGFSISRADVADCMLGALENPLTIRKILGASH
jgi:putative NADH-flavin reductase